MTVFCRAVNDGFFKVTNEIGLNCERVLNVLSNTHPIPLGAIRLRVRTRPSRLTRVRERRMRCDRLDLCAPVVACHQASQVTVNKR